MISGKIVGGGIDNVSLVVAKRSTVKPVCLIEVSRGADTGEKDGILSLANGRVEALIDPSACGQIFSLQLDGVENLHSSHPVPGEFAWEKPWFGGIHPRYMEGENNRPFALEKETPPAAVCRRTRGGVVETGWRMNWSIDNRDFGSMNLEWTVWLLPELPVLKTELLCTAIDGEYIDGELDIRGFVKPGGSLDNGILTCEMFPGMMQGREHSGAWAPLGNWGRVQRGNFFAETLPGDSGNLLCEDYGELGCHFTLYTIHSRRTHLSMTWVFGDGTGDDLLADVYRSHR